jgi:hypothetical protein
MDSETLSMPRASGLLVVIALGLFSARADAQLEPGLKVGASVGGFKVHAVTGENAGKVVDPVSERKDKATVFVFLHAKDWDRPMARFLKKLDQEFANGIAGVDDPATVAVWMTDDPEKSKVYLPRAQESLKFNHTKLTVFEGDAEGPSSWDLNAGARLSVVIVREGRVTGSFGYRSLNETDVAGVVKAIKAK